MNKSDYIELVYHGMVISFTRFPSTMHIDNWLIYKQYQREKNCIEALKMAVSVEKNTLIEVQERILFTKLMYFCMFTKMRSPFYFCSAHSKKIRYKTTHSKSLLRV